MTFPDTAISRSFENSKFFPSIFLFLFWCLKHAPCGSSRVQVLNDTPGRPPEKLPLPPPHPREKRRPATLPSPHKSHRAHARSAWTGRVLGRLQAEPCAPLLSRLAEPRKGLLWFAGSESKGGAGSNRKNNSVSQSCQYYSGAQVTARQGASGPERRWSCGPG